VVQSKLVVIYTRNWGTLEEGKVFEVLKRKAHGRISRQIEPQKKKDGYWPRQTHL
jgi:hypothetical protein